MENKKGKKIKKTEVDAKKKETYLFKTVTVIDEKEFMKYQNFYLNKFKNNIIPIMVMIILAILAIGVSYRNGNYHIVYTIIGFVVIYPIALKWTLNNQIKKMYKTNKKINMLEETISFYDDCLESKSIHNWCKVEYKDLYKICETKSNFYIFMSDNQAFIIIKECLDDVDKFRNFIIDKANYRKYR